MCKRRLPLNFNTAFNIAKPIFAHMLEKGNGRIVFIGSKPALEASAGKGVIAYGLSKTLLFKLADYLNADAKGKNVVTTVIVPSTIDTALNRKSMPDTDPEKWVKASAIAEILEFVVSEKGAPLRETVLKVYNNA
jgi:NAD(P)-dependent dehydrogenase (short-subunit alcohol dehydrogenase family)